MKTICLAAAIALALPAASSAAVFTTRAAFNAAVPGVVNNDLNSIPLGPVTTIFGVETIRSGSNPAGGFISDYGNGFGRALGGLGATGGVNNFDSVIVDFTAPIYAFAFDDLDLTGNESEFANIVVTLVGGSTQSFTLSETDSDFSTAAFFGFASSTAIDFVTVWSSDTPGGAVGTRANLIDNLAISRIAVPEPATWGLMIAGFALAGATLRRRSAMLAGAR